MDGTLCDYAGGLANSFNMIAHELEPQYKASDFGDLDNEPDWMYARRKFITSQGYWWLHLNELRSGIWLYKRSIDIGFQPVVCTKGPYDKPEAWSNKMLWCRQHLPGDSTSVTITEDKSLIYGSILVDDWPDYIRSWLRVRPRGLVIMPAQSWNKDYEHSRVFRFTNSKADQRHATCILKQVYQRKIKEV